MEIDVVTALPPENPIKSQSKEAPLFTNIWWWPCHRALDKLSEIGPPSRRIHIKSSVEKRGPFEFRWNAIEASCTRRVGKGTGAGQDCIIAVRLAVLEFADKACSDR